MSPSVRLRLVLNMHGPRLWCFCSHRVQAQIRKRSSLGPQSIPGVQASDHDVATRATGALTPSSTFCRACSDSEPGALRPSIVAASITLSVGTFPKPSSLLSPRSAVAHDWTGCVCVCRGPTCVQSPAADEAAGEEVESSVGVGVEDTLLVISDVTSAVCARTCWSARGRVATEEQREEEGKEKRERKGGGGRGRGRGHL